MPDKIYGMCDRAWQPLVGCDPHMSCAPNCWAVRTVRRVVECQKTVAPKRAEFYQIALSADGKKWSGETVLDDLHMVDPLKWRKPALIACGFHGDWGRLSPMDMLAVLKVPGMMPRHAYMTLTKQPQNVAKTLEGRRWREFTQARNEPYRALVIHGEHAESDLCALPNVTIGCSIMTQADADAMLGPMSLLSQWGWKTHVWYEPARGLVDWEGWDFIECLIYGGESGPLAKKNSLDWPAVALEWCGRKGVKFWMKQLGNLAISEISGAIDTGDDKKGQHLDSLPAWLRVREIPDWWKVGGKTS